MKGFKFNVLSFLTKKEKALVREILESLTKKYKLNEDEESTIEFYFKKCKKWFYFSWEIN